MAFFGLTTENVRVDHNNKVLNVNQNNNLYDARVVVQVKKIASNGRSPCNMYVSSYENPVDATVAVTLLWHLLETTVATPVGKLTYKEFLRALAGDDKRLEKEKDKLTGIVKQLMERMKQAMQVDPRVGLGFTAAGR